MLVLPGEMVPADVEAIRQLTFWYVQVMRAVAEESLGLPFPRLEIWMLDLTEALTALASRVVGPPRTSTAITRPEEFRTGAPTEATPSAFSLTLTA